MKLTFEVSDEFVPSQESCRLALLATDSLEHEGNNVKANLGMLQFCMQFSTQHVVR